MKKNAIFRIMILIAVFTVINCNLFAQNNDVVTASYTSMTVPDPTGGKWIWGNNLSIGDTASIVLNGNINHYDVPWCASYGCCDSLSLNGMSISVHTIKPDTNYIISITGGLSAGAYFTDGFVEIPSNWNVDSITDMSNDPGNGAYYTVINNKITFHAGTTYEGCACSDCGRAKLNFYISKTSVAISETTNRNKLILIYPNPAKDIITIADRSGDNSPVMILIYDIHGLLLLHQTIHNTRTEIDVSKLEKGVYIVKVNGEKFNDIAKIIKE